MNTVYRRLPEDEIAWRSPGRRYLGFAVVVFLILLLLSLIALSIIHLGRDAAVYLAGFIVGGLCGITLERRAR